METWKRIPIRLRVIVGVLVLALVGWLSSLGSEQKTASKVEESHSPADARSAGEHVEHGGANCLLANAFVDGHLELIPTYPRKGGYDCVCGYIVENKLLCTYWGPTARVPVEFTVNGGAVVDFRLPDGDPNVSPGERYGSCRADGSCRARGLADDPRTRLQCRDERCLDAIGALRGLCGANDRCDRGLRCSRGRCWAGE